MPHDIALISTIAAALGCGLGLGLLAVRMHLPALVGYLAAGIMIGPFTPGFVGDSGLAAQLAEIGVMLLMFGVGLRFSIADLIAVKRIAVPGAVLQIASATAMGTALSAWWGWSLGTGLVFGLSLSVASTVVLLRALESRNSLNTHEGRVAVGWLVVEDLVMVLTLVLLPPLAQSFSGDAAQTPDTLMQLVARTLLQIGGFVAFMLLIGRKLFPAILAYVAQTGSRELFTLSVIAAALGVAFASAKVFGVSFALGAFFAGVVLRESHLSHRAATDTQALRDAFSVLFFVSVGMLFDPRVLMTHPLETIAVVAIIMVGKSIAALLLVVALRYPLSLALTVAASLAQIGEFSFILVSMGQHLGLIDDLARNLILAGAIFSIGMNPLLFKMNDVLLPVFNRIPWVERLKNRFHDPLATIPENTPHDRLRHHIVIVGCGRIGQRVMKRLKHNRIPVVVVDQNRELIERLRAQDLQAVAGDASDPGTLIQAHIVHASVLLIAIPDIVGLKPIVETATQLNPGIRILIRSHGTDESDVLRPEQMIAAISAEDALSDVMVQRILSELEHIKADH